MDGDVIIRKTQLTSLNTTQATGTDSHTPSPAHLYPTCKRVTVLVNKPQTFLNSWSACQYPSGDSIFNPVVAITSFFVVFNYVLRGYSESSRETHNPAEPQFPPLQHVAVRTYACSLAGHSVLPGSGEVVRKVLQQLFILQKLCGNHRSLRQDRRGLGPTSWRLAETSETDWAREEARESVPGGRGGRESRGPGLLQTR